MMESWRLDLKQAWLLRSGCDVFSAADWSQQTSWWKHLMFKSSLSCFRCSAERCSSVWLRSSRTVLWTTTRHLTLYHQEEERRTLYQHKFNMFLVYSLIKWCRKTSCKVVLIYRNQLCLKFWVGWAALWQTVSTENTSRGSTAEWRLTQKQRWLTVKSQLKLRDFLIKTVWTIKSPVCLSHVFKASVDS